MLLPAGLGLIATKLVVDDRVYRGRHGGAASMGESASIAPAVAEGRAGRYYWLRSGNDIVRLSANAISAG